MTKETGKKNLLLKSAYNLFTTKGFNSTTIQDIVDAAKVAKGTFYLYFEDKYHLQEQLVVEKSKELFQEALNELKNHRIKKFEDQIIFVIDYVIDILTYSPELLTFISKDLSLGVYSDKLSRILDNGELGIYDVFLKGIKENNIKLKKPEVTLFMIIELTSSTCFSVITKKIDMTMDAFKPYLHKAIKSLINNS